MACNETATRPKSFCLVLTHDWLTHLRSSGVHIIQNRLYMAQTHELKDPKGYLCSFDSTIHKREADFIDEVQLMP